MVIAARAIFACRKIRVFVITLTRYFYSKHLGWCDICARNITWGPGAICPAPLSAALREYPGTCAIVVFINDIPKVTDGKSPALFADDTKVYKDVSR
jgi:hypothetical protein